MPCPASWAAGSSHSEVATGCPERLCMVIGEMKRAPAAVIATRTSAPCLRRAVTTEAAL